MKKLFLNCIALAVVLLLSFSALSVRPSAKQSSVAKVRVAYDINEALKAKFLNMLNHNFAYDSAFESAEDLVNCAVTAQLNLREKQNDSYIAENYIKDYLLNMYGVEIEDFSDINASFPHKDGFVYIVPRGFSVFSHSNAVVAGNEDGSYTVTTDVTVNSHDSDEVNGKAVTLFVKSSESKFGFYMVSSNIYFDTDNA
ncbi:MAG: hypothetical protein II252_04995 [Clostridia bacterium]|nr:hypothetical protein [Clostridia bacterium]